ncbi:MAG TPA: hypothetical protein VI544_00275 [Candidatus Nanoarchaeia archaeon]|nr:hypothetical protein [Candidatus Nanoarchaeia archaeon]
MNLAELKKNYSVLEKKHKLPSFSSLNEDFEIEKVRRGEETLVRTIRKTMMEKVVNSLGFVESLLNPMNAPRMYLAYIKSITSEDKKGMDEIYSSLSEVVLASLNLEIDYSEKKEADMINQIFKTWTSLKPGFRKIIGNMQKPIFSPIKEKSYFG